MKEKIEELIINSYNDCKEIYKQLRFWSDKKESYYEKKDIRDKNFKIDVDYINSQIYEFNDKAVLNKIERNIYLVYYCALVYYIAFVFDNEKIMNETKEKIDISIKKIKNDLDLNHYVFYKRDVDYKTEILRALARVENIMYFPNCKVNNYEYLTHLSLLEELINNYKKNDELLEDKKEFSIK